MSCCAALKPRRSSTIKECYQVLYDTNCGLLKVSHGSVLEPHRLSSLSYYAMADALTMNSIDTAKKLLLWYLEL